jgi:IS1 family transposase
MNVFKKMQTIDVENTISRHTLARLWRVRSTMDSGLTMHSFFAGTRLF